MTKKYKIPVQSLIDHIKTATDVDPWAKEMAEELLKEQEATWVEYPECLKYENAYSTDHIVCSACQYVFSTIDNCTEEFMHCPHCGAKMK
jgi:hypothetical protein